MVWQLFLQWVKDTFTLAEGRRVAPGQGLVEYALILIFVAVVIVIILTVLGPGITNIYSNIVAVLQQNS